MNLLTPNPTDSETLYKQLKQHSDKQDSLIFIADVINSYRFLQVRPGFDPLIEAIIHINLLNKKDREALIKLLNEW